MIVYLSKKKKKYPIIEFTDEKTEKELGAGFSSGVFPLSRVILSFVAITTFLIRREAEGKKQKGIFTPTTCSNLKFQVYPP